MLWDLIFPKTCVGCGKLGSYFCGECISAFPLSTQVCPMCNLGSVGGLTHFGCRKSLGMDGLVCVFPYRESVQDFVKKLKYRFVSEMGVSAGGAISSRLDKSMTNFFKRNDFSLVAVPLHKLRERWRGFNQASLLSKQLASEWSLSDLEILVRVKDTKSLAESRVRLTKQEGIELEIKYVSSSNRRSAKAALIVKKKTQLRIAQMKGAFKVREGCDLSGVREVVIIDDVWTSGATMRECVKCLKRNGVSRVWGLVFARSGLR